MKIVRANRLVVTNEEDFYSHQRICYKPFDRYVVTDWETVFLKDNTVDTHWTWSSFNSYNRPYHGQDLNGRRVMIFRHTAFGDQLMVSAIPRYIKARFPHATVHLYCNPVVQGLWEGNPFVEGGACPIPMPLDAVKHYDCHMFFEGMLEGNSEYDQGCCYDDMFASIGMKPEDKWKKPYFHMLPSDYESVGSLDITGKYMVYHWSPANRNRCYPYEQSLKFLKQFRQAFPSWRVIVVGVNPEKQWEARLDEVQKDDPKVVNLLNKTKHFRYLAPIVESAGLVVCPDSAVMHMAAAFDVTTISLWGLFHPNDRAKYYLNHHAIFKGKDVCPTSPCHDHNFHLPLEQCKDAEGAPKEKKDIQWCQVLAAISPEEIVAKAQGVLR